MNDSAKPPETLDGAPSRRSRLGTALGAAPYIKLLTLAIVASAMLAGAVTGCHGHPGHARGPEHLREFAEWRVERMLKKVDATPEQQEQVKAIVDGLIAELAELHGEPREMHDALEAELTAATIDRVTLEALRGRQVEEIDAASRRVVDALASIAEILTQEQRIEIAEHVGRFKHGRHGGWGRE